MSDTENEKKCCCNDESLQQTRNCLNCKNEWTRNLDDLERVSNCPEHHMRIQICSPDYRLCPSCTEQGYYVVPKDGFGIGFNSEIEIKKKDDTQ